MIYVQTLEFSKRREEPDGPYAKLVIYGPFPDDAAASAFGKTWQAENEDCPCWQIFRTRGHLTVEFRPAVRNG